MENKLREILKDLVRKEFGLSMKQELDDIDMIPIEDALLALQQEWIKMLPQEKLTFEHRQIKIGNNYVRETDSRYNAGYNDCLSDMHSKITGGK